MPSPNTRTTSCSARALGVTAATVIAACSGFVHAQASGDFNGDGFADLAIGVPGEDLGAIDAGAVAVLYGSASGLTAVNDQLWHQNSPFIAGDASEGDRFGTALAVGDFNGDGFDDIAVGIPGDEVNSQDGAGGISVLYGSALGISTANNQQLDLSIAELPFDLAQGAAFGSALAAGDFNNDGIDDLLAGAPGLNTGSGGAVILFGTGAGLSGSDSVGFTQATAGIADTPEAADGFGAKVAAGDFNGDGFHDVAIAATGEDLGAIVDAGAVHVIYSDANGPNAGFSQFWSQNSSNIPEGAQAGDAFGAALATGDFDADGFDDLAIGVPTEDLGNVGQLANAGVVHLLFGRSIGLRPAGNVLVRQRPSDNTASEENDRFGDALAFGDFNADGFADLAISASGEDLQDVGAGLNINGGGAVSIYLGNPLRQVASAGDPLYQNGTGLARARSNDQFGFSLAAGDFDGDGDSDLAVGIPFKDFTLATDAGAMEAFYGSNAGTPLNRVAGQVWSQNSAGIANNANADDGFGRANSSQ